MDSFETVWQRIRALEGAVFHTVTGKAFTYRCGPGYLVPNRANQNLARSQFEQAYARLPVSGPGALQDLRGPSYLYAVLNDVRISRSRGEIPASPRRPRPGFVAGS